MLKLSKASKMSCRSWSLEALSTCPASKDSQGNLVPACKGCYATTGNYRFPNVKAPRVHNKEDWQREQWTQDMVAELDNDRYFRWFDSGDMYSLGLATKILEVARNTPHCNHWIPTRMHKFTKFAKVLSELEALPNVVVRYSSDSITGETLSHKGNQSTIVPTVDHAAKGMSLCRAYEQEGKCLTCRQCWNKDVKVIAYLAHGAKMGKQIKELGIIAKG